MERQDRGCVHLYVGDGKGKTTAAAGLALRALGCGKRVLFCQFLKGRASGELRPLAEAGAEILRAKTGEKFLFQMDEAELAQALREQQSCFEAAARRLLEDRFDLAVLDEVVDAVNAGAVELDALTGLIRTRPPHQELVLTGRNPDGALVELCDYHTDFVCRRHPYQSGLPARQGIEY